MNEVERLERRVVALEAELWKTRGMLNSTLGVVAVICTALGRPIASALAAAEALSDATANASQLPEGALDAAREVMELFRKAAEGNQDPRQPE